MSGVLLALVGLVVLVAAPLPAEMRFVLGMSCMLIGVSMAVRALRESR